MRMGNVGWSFTIKGVLMTDLLIARQHRFNEDALAIAFIRVGYSLSMADVAE